MAKTEPTRSPRKPDHWSGRKTLIFIVLASLLLWGIVALVVHLIA